MQRIHLMRLFCCCALLALMGCTTPEEAFVSDVTAFDPDHTAIVKLKNREAAARGELKLFLRTNDRFREDSLTVRIGTFTPDSLHTEELHRLILPATRRINALKRVVEIPYRRAVELPHAGNYYFTITPTRPTEGVEAVGILFRTEQTDHYGKR